MKHPNFKFIWKIVRNGLILTALYFISVYASADTLTYETCKPALVFFFGYIFAELAHHYKLNTPTARKLKVSPTLVF